MMRRLAIMVRMAPAAKASVELRSAPLDDLTTVKALFVTTKKRVVTMASVTIRPSLLLPRRV
ncbi:hypothetical protein F751_3762 [Auxenochlorella protothecoides]|uniref:Uncharacterized protein n=1 Tax=Auxenochlorella protothecoides TaxID=3075 RepID=A0A087SG96_AUXPR|nr:hypothetical protein F751_3762 [Auxenochlorella protothecoides]KFM24750.1 hypothetical protein F751_3762 [Auxenochlorella protothecoides]